MKTIQSIDRAMLILEYIAQHNNTCTLTDISTALELKLPTLHGFLVTLEAWNVVSKNGNKYSLGGKLFELGKVFESHLSVQAILHPYLEQLAAEFDETIYLAIPSNKKLLYIDEVESKHPLRLSSIVGTTEAYETSAIGMAVLANLPEAFWQETAAQSGMELELLQSKLLDIQKKGYYIHRKPNCDCYCIAVALAGIHHTTIGISMFIPAYRYTEELAQKVIDVMVKMRGRIRAEWKR